MALTQSKYRLAGSHEIVWKLLELNPEPLCNEPSQWTTRSPSLHNGSRDKFFLDWKLIGFCRCNVSRAKKKIQWMPPICSSRLLSKRGLDSQWQPNNWLRLSPIGFQLFGFFSLFPVLLKVFDTTLKSRLTETDEDQSWQRHETAKSSDQTEKQTSF